MSPPDPRPPTVAGRRSRLPEPLLAALRAALALVAPCDCAGCGAPDVELCARCRDHLGALLPAVDELPDGTPLVSAAVYTGVVRDVVLEFKQSGRWRLARHFGPVLARALAEIARLDASAPRASPIVVLAAPPSRAGRRRRGYDPVELLLRAAGAVSARPGLRILRSSPSQKTLSRADRLRSREGTLACPTRWAGRRIVIVDDVATSGATLVEAVRAAREAGCVVVGACVLAATPLVSEESPHFEVAGAPV